MSVEMKKGDTGNVVDCYKKTNVSTSVVRIIQGYTRLIDAAVWYKT